LTDELEEVVVKILEKIPRPNLEELWGLYEELDKMTKRVLEVLMLSEHFEKESFRIRFDEMGASDIEELIMKDREVMIPFFAMICGLSIRELERLFGIKDVYNLRGIKKIGKRSKRKLKEFAEVVSDLLQHPLTLETVAYKFYKNWEEHQKRHFRGRRVQDAVTEGLKKYGFDVGRIELELVDQKREIDCAIPPDPNNIEIAIQVRTGVRRDLAKRAKEFSSEYDEMAQHYPNIGFIPVYVGYGIDINDARKVIESERKGKRPYLATVVSLSPEEAVGELVKVLQRIDLHRGVRARS